ncbi:MAG: hypothetical protein RMY28_000605 [Nostoc sp. ChiSLP01]
MVDTLQQVMLSFEKLYFAKLDAAEYLLRYVEKLVKIIRLMTTRLSTTRYYICSRVSD